MSGSSGTSRHGPNLMHAIQQEKEPLKWELWDFIGRQSRRRVRHWHDLQVATCCQLKDSLILKHFSFILYSYYCKSRKGTLDLDLTKYWTVPNICLCDFQPHQVWSLPFSMPLSFFASIVTTLRCIFIFIFDYVWTFDPIHGWFGPCKPASMIIIRKIDNCCSLKPQFCFKIFKSVLSKRGPWLKHQFEVSCSTSNRGSWNYPFWWKQTMQKCVAVLRDFPPKGALFGWGKWPLCNHWPSQGHYPPQLLFTPTLGAAPAAPTPATPQTKLGRKPGGFLRPKRLEGMIS